MSMLSDLLCVSLQVRSVETAKLWAIQRWPNWPVWGLLLTIFAYRYIHCNFAEISTGDFIANHWFIDQITLQMPGKIIDRLIWQILALSNIYKYIIFAAAAELHGGGGLQAGHQLRPLLGLLQQVGHCINVSSSYLLISIYSLMWYFLRQLTQLLHECPFFWKHLVHNEEYEHYTCLAKDEVALCPYHHFVTKKSLRATHTGCWEGGGGEGLLGWWPPP